MLSRWNKHEEGLLVELPTQETERLEDSPGNRVVYEANYLHDQPITAELESPNECSPRAELDSSPIYLGHETNEQSTSESMHPTEIQNVSPYPARGVEVDPRLMMLQNEIHCQSPFIGNGGAWDPIPLDFEPAQRGLPTQGLTDSIKRIQAQNESNGQVYLQQAMQPPPTYYGPNVPSSRSFKFQSHNTGTSPTSGHRRSDAIRSSDTTSGFLTPSPASTVRTSPETFGSSVPGSWKHRFSSECACLSCQSSWASGKAHGRISTDMLPSSAATSSRMHQRTGSNRTVPFWDIPSSVRATDRGFGTSEENAGLGPAAQGPTASMLQNTSDQYSRHRHLDGPMCRPLQPQTADHTGLCVCHSADQSWQVQPKIDGNISSAKTKSAPRDPLTMKSLASKCSDLVRSSCCRHCGKKFCGDWRSGNLARHLRQKHAVEEGIEPAPPIRCKKCDRGFKRKDALTKHEWTLHRVACEPVKRGKHSNSSSSCQRPVDAFNVDSRLYELQEQASNVDDQ